MENTAENQNGAQPGAQNVQNAPQSSGNNSNVSQFQQARPVQVSTDAQSLTNSQGITLTQPPLPSINLPAARTSLAQAAPPQTPKREVKPLMAILPLTLFILAIFLFWLAGRGEKNKSYNK